MKQNSKYIEKMFVQSFLDYGDMALEIYVVPYWAPIWLLMSIAITLLAIYPLFIKLGGYISFILSICITLDRAQH